MKVWQKRLMFGVHAFAGFLCGGFAIMNFFVYHWLVITILIVAALGNVAFAMYFVIEEESQGYARDRFVEEVKMKW